MPASRSFSISSVIPLSFTESGSGQVTAQFQRVTHKKAEDPLMICVRAQCAPTAEGQTTTLHPKGMNKGLKESLQWHTKFQFQQGNKQGKKQKRSLHSQFEGEKHFPTYCTPGSSQFLLYSHTVQLAPIFNVFLWTKSQTQLHTQLPQRDSEFLAHQLSGIFDNSRCAGRTWKRVLSSTAIWAPHCKPQLPQQNKTSTKFCSYSPDEHFMNWNSKDPNSGNNCFYKQEILVSSIAKSGLPSIKSYFMLSTQCLYTSNAFSAVLRMRSLIGWRQNYKNKKKIPNLNL